MSSWKNPVGSESKGVYIRRRLLVLAGFLGIVLFVALVIIKPGSTGGAATAPEVKLPDEITAAEKPEVTDGATPVCSQGELLVTPLTDSESYSSGALPQLSLQVENTADHSCQADLGTQGMTFTVTSGSDEVWRSTDCQVDPESLLVILEAGQTLTTEPLEWDRTRSAPETCEAERPRVGGGGATYHLHVAVAGVPGQGTARFLLY